MRLDCSGEELMATVLEAMRLRAKFDPVYCGSSMSFSNPVGTEEVPEIEACVCALDSFCCGVTYDSICADIAVDSCNAEAKPGQQASFSRPVSR